MQLPIRSRYRTTVNRWGAVLLGACLFLPASVLAQQSVLLVRGTVLRDATAEPVSGVSIAVKGTNAGALSDEMGAFTIRVSSLNDSLIVRRVGFAPARVGLAGRSTLVVRLTETATTLSGVVVVGYGTQKRSDITGSVTSVSSAKLEEKPNISIEQALQGAVAGLVATSSSAGAEPSLNVQIRGRNSISASTSPLVVVDGIPFNGPLSEINPNDIASIEVLKDASAAAIYGSRGSNGVLLVTSRKGTPGKIKFNFSSNTSQLKLTGLPALMDAKQFAEFKCVRLRTTTGQDCATTLTTTELLNQQAGVNTNWALIGIQTGNQVQNNVSMTGGSDDTRFLFGASTLDVDGVAVNDKFKRRTVRFNLDQKVTSWLSAGTATQPARTDRGGIPIDFTNAFYQSPLISPYQADGVTPLINPWPEEPVNGRNPIDRTLAQSDDINTRVFSSNYALVTIPQVPGLSYRLNAGLDYANRNSGSYYGRNTTDGTRFQGLATVSNTVRNDWTIEHILSYKHVLGRGNLDITGLSSRQASDLQNNTRNAQAFPNDVLGYRSSLPTLNVSTASVTQSMLVSQMARVNYAYDDRYLLTMTTRRDGYSGFGANNKYGVFPSVALGWNVANESFFPFKKSVDALKLRASLGENGNQAIKPYQTLAQLSDRSYLTGDSPAAGYVPATLGNPNLKWETTRSRNVGMDLGLWNGRITTTVDAYSSDTRDLLLLRAISPVQGISSLIQNIGRTANKGIDVQLSSVNIDRSAFRWSTDLTYAANRNKIVDLYGNGADDVGNGWFINSPIDVNYAYMFGGVFQTADNIATSAQPTAKPGDVRVLDANGDGKIDASDRMIIGSRVPTYTAGLTNTIKVHGFTLSAFLQTVQGVTRLNDLLSTGIVNSNVSRNTLQLTYWSPTNAISTYPENRTTANPFGVGFYEDASFVRLKDISLSYDVPERLLGKVGAQTARLYVNGRNLKTWTKWTGLDPELSNQRAVPLERAITGGLTLRY